MPSAYGAGAIGLPDARCPWRAPEGNRNALKHSGFTAETVAPRKKIVALARLARETMAAIE